MPNDPDVKALVERATSLARVQNSLHAQVILELVAVITAQAAEIERLKVRCSDLTQCMIAAAIRGLKS
jgi:uncharacterized coiled-coil protein SlyX